MSESVTGVVSAVSASGTGIQINNEWFNYSSRIQIETKPIRGQKVTLQFEPQEYNGRINRWIQAVEILDGGAVQQRPGGGGAPRGRPVDERREIMRQTALKAATEFSAAKAQVQEGVTSQAVLQIADLFYAWLTKQ